VLIAWIGVALFSACTSPSKKVEDVQDEVTEAQEDLIKAKVLTLMWRYAILLSFGWALPVVLFFLVFFLVFFAAYFGLLSHSIIPLPNAVTFRQKQLSNTVDLMPGSWFGEFCTGGLNTHAVHHVWPHLPRGLHGWASKQLNDL
jgi:fatty acid desaturase